MALIRTFIGIKASQRVTANAARVISRMEATEADYRWVAEENLHVTLNFVGDVKDVETHELCQLIAGTLRPFKPFDLSLQGVGGFPNSQQPRVLWMGVDEGAAALREMYVALSDTLHHWGVNKDRKEYVPHMTLGRVKRGGRWNEPLLELVHRLRNHDGGSCQVQEVIVFASYLDKRGPTHTPMSRIKLTHH